VTLLNALPKPTSAACFVESLDRTFTASATSSQFSAQPAFSARSPRVFFKFDQLWVSVVLDGSSSDLLDFSYELDESRSIKGEILTPITAALVSGVQSLTADATHFYVNTIEGELLRWDL
jgi:hypothetical protein